MLNAQTHPDLNTGLDFSRNNPHVQIKLYAGRDFQRSKHSWSHVLTCIIHVSQSIFKQEEQSCWSHWLCCLFLCFCLFFCKLQLVFIEISFLHQWLMGVNVCFFWSFIFVSRCRKPTYCIHPEGSCYISCLSSPRPLIVYFLLQSVCEGVKVKWRWLS